MGNALTSYVEYIGKALWPTRLAVFYPHPGEASAALPVLAATSVLVGITALVARQVARRPYLIVGWLWYLGTLVPVIGLIQVGRQGMADRYTYLPLVGLFIMVAWGARDLARRFRLGQGALSAVATATLLLLSAMTWLQIGTWRSSRTLFEHAVHVTTNNRVAHFNLGAVLMEEGLDDAAALHFEEALRIEPRFYPAHQNLEVLFSRMGNDERALRHRAASQWAITEMAGAYGSGVAAVRPGPLAPPGRASLHYRLGAGLAIQGRMDEAGAEFTEALRLDPASVDAVLGLGTVLLIRGDTDGAIRHYEDAVQQRPEDERGHYRLAVALVQQGLTREATIELEAVLRLNPTHRAARDLMRRL